MNATWPLLTQALAALVLGFGLITAYLYLHAVRLRSRQERERLVVESDRRYGRLFHTVSDLVYVHDLDGKILEVNGAAGRLLGGDAAAVTGKRLHDVLGARYAKEVEGYLRRHRGGATSTSGIILLSLGPDDGPVVLEFRSSIVVETGGQVHVQGIARDITERRAAESALRRRDRQMRRLLADADRMQELLLDATHELRRIQELERKKVSRELHDEIGQLLATMTLNLEAMKRNPGTQDDAALRSQIQEVERIAHEIFGRIRKVLRDLRPVILDKSGLVVSIQRLLTEFTKRSGVITILSRTCDDVERLSDDKKIALYRILQESLTNVSKHAHARIVTIGVERVADRIHLRIEDDGNGFSADPGASPAAAGGGIGLAGMRERVDLVQGEFAVESKEGFGTSIHVAIPTGEARRSHPMGNES